MKKTIKSKKLIKKMISLTAAVITLLSMTSCSAYKSRYKAVGFVHSNESASSFMSFYRFDGTMVFKMKSAGEGDLTYSAKLESGSATVYYDYRGSKTELFSINAGEEIGSHGGYVEKGTVYVIVETNGECQNGDLKFSLDHS
ncbi:MAG: hypothetical protein K6F09_03135 [Clostridiales bacterium]|nr:hypothetical protein [Clostridiales bacterium]